MILGHIVYEGSSGITTAVVPFLLERVMALTKEQIKEFEAAEKKAEGKEVYVDSHHNSGCDGS